jgi:hypothetical protein
VIGKNIVVEFPLERHCSEFLEFHASGPCRVRWAELV